MTMKLIYLCIIILDKKYIYICVYTDMCIYIYNHGFPNTFDYNHYVYSDYLVCSVPAIAHIIRY